MTNKEKTRKDKQRAELHAHVTYYIKMNRYSKKELAAMLGMSLSTFYEKLNAPDKFTLYELKLLFSILKLDDAAKLRMIA